MAAINNNVQWLQSSKDRPMLCIDDYLFTDKGKGKQPNVRYWACNKKCGATAKTVGQVVVQLNGIVNAPDHGHPNDTQLVKDTVLKVSH